VKEIDVVRVICHRSQGTLPVFLCCLLTGTKSWNERDICFFLCAGYTLLGFHKIFYVELTKKKEEVLSSMKDIRIQGLVI
jgi:hypothetical protein